MQAKDQPSGEGWYITRKQADQTTGLVHVNGFRYQKIVDLSLRLITIDGSDVEWYPSVLGDEWYGPFLMPWQGDQSWQPQSMINELPCECGCGTVLYRQNGYTTLTMKEGLMVSYVFPEGWAPCYLEGREVNELATLTVLD